jgi:hypothetical protein
MSRRNNRGSLAHDLVGGAIAGAVGTLALDATTYTDIAVRGRPPSDTPAQMVERIAQDAHVGVLNMATIAADVNRDSVSAGLFADHRRGDDAGFSRATRLPHGRDMIDVDVESCCHWL